MKLLLNAARPSIADGNNAHERGNAHGNAKDGQRAPHFVAGQFAKCFLKDGANVGKHV